MAPLGSCSPIDTRSKQSEMEENKLQLITASETSYNIFNARQLSRGGKPARKAKVEDVGKRIAKFMWKWA